MVETSAAATAAAIKIQALARGNRDRRQVEVKLLEMIEVMMARTKEEKQKEETAKPAAKPAQLETQESHDSEDVEEIIVLIDGDDTEDEDGNEEIVVEIVVEETPKPPPLPPARRKSAFERYNEQLKKPVDRTKRQKPDPPRRASMDAPGATLASIPKKGLKNDPNKDDLDDISNHMLRISNHSSELEGDSIHGSSVKIGIPWLKPAASEPSSRDSSPPPPPRPLTKNPLVDRYLSAAVTRDSKEYEEKMAQIEADRSRGRWHGVGPDPRGNTEASSKSEDWKWQQPKPPRQEFDGEAAIKLQALVRGFLARRRVVKLLDSLIEEMLRKLNKEEELKKFQKEKEEEEALKKLQKEKEEEEALKKLQKEKEEETENYFKELRKKQIADAKRQKEEREELRRRMEEKARRIKEKEEEQRRQEIKEAKRKEIEAEEKIMRREWEAYDRRKGFPLWWMELVPHNTLSQEEYEAEINKDEVATIIDYKPPDGWTKRFSKPLDAVAEEIDDDDSEEDENSSNLDKILPDVTDAAPRVTSAVAPKVTQSMPQDTTTETPQETPQETKANPKNTKRKKRRSFFSCICMDAVEIMEVNATSSHDSSNATSIIANTEKANDGIESTNNGKGDTELSGPMVDRVLDSEQAPPSSSATKIVLKQDVTEDTEVAVVENDMTEDVKLIEEWRSKRSTGSNI